MVAGRFDPAEVVTAQRTDCVCAQGSYHTYHTLGLAALQLIVFSCRSSRTTQCFYWAETRQTDTSMTFGARMITVYPGSSYKFHPRCGMGEHHTPRWCSVYVSDLTMLCRVHSLSLYNSIEWQCFSARRVEGVCYF